MMQTMMKMKGLMRMEVLKEETMAAIERVPEKEENELLDEEKGILEAKATATATGSVLPQ